MKNIKKDRNQIHGNENTMSKMKDRISVMKNPLELNTEKENIRELEVIE